MPVPYRSSSGPSLSLSIAPGVTLLLSFRRLTRLCKAAEALLRNAQEDSTEKRDALRDAHGRPRAVGDELTFYRWEVLRSWKDEQGYQRSKKALRVRQGTVMAAFGPDEQALTARQLGLPKARHWSRLHPLHQHGYYRKYLVRIDTETGPEYRVVQQPALLPSGSAVVNGRIQLAEAEPHHSKN